MTTRTTYARLVAIFAGSALVLLTSVSATHPDHIQAALISVKSAGARMKAINKTTAKTSTSKAAKKETARRDTAQAERMISTVPAEIAPPLPEAQSVEPEGWNSNAFAFYKKYCLCKCERGLYDRNDPDWPYADPYAQVRLCGVPLESDQCPVAPWVAMEVPHETDCFDISDSRYACWGYDRASGDDTQAGLLTHCEARVGVRPIGRDTAQYIE